MILKYVYGQHITATECDVNDQQTSENQSIFPVRKAAKEWKHHDISDAVQSLGHDKFCFATLGSVSKLIPKGTKTVKHPVVSGQLAVGNLYTGEQLAKHLSRKMKSGLIEALTINS